MSDPNTKMNGRTKRMIEGSLFMTISTVIVNLTRFVLIVVLLRYYSKEEFGIWSAITSSAAVIATGDFGIVNALRNKVSILLTSGEAGLKLAREYFYTSFYFFLVLSLLLSGSIYMLGNFIPFEALFKTDNNFLRGQGATILMWVQFLFFINIPLSMGSPLFFSFQESKISSYFSFFQAIFSFLLVVILSLFHCSIVIISISYFLINVIVGFAGTVYFIYLRRWYNWRVSKEHFFARIKELFGVGIRFMGLQLTGSYIQNIGTIMASAVLSVSIAGEFSMIQKLYTFGLGVYQSALNPIWAGYADAYAKKDAAWCRKTLTYSLLVTFGLFTAGLIFLSFFGNTLLSWIGGNDYSSSMLLYVLLGIVTLFYALFVCTTVVQYATNKINLILILSIVMSLAGSSGCKYLALKFGMSGLAFGMSGMWIVLFLVLVVQSYRIIGSISKTS